MPSRKFAQSNDSVKVRLFNSVCTNMYVCTVIFGVITPQQY